MSNLTFDEQLIREHIVEPLGGHTVVLLERLGEAGERFHLLLEPGAKRPRRGLLSFLRGKSDRYIAFAVDASRNRSLKFTEHVWMDDQAFEFDLQFNLWYYVADPQLLVQVRNSDPLRQVQRRVGTVIAEAVAELPWVDVKESFRASSERVVESTRAELQTFAYEYGLGIIGLGLSLRFPDNASGIAREIHEVREKRRLQRELLDAAQELESHRSNLRRDNYNREEEEAYARRINELISRVQPALGELRELVPGMSESVPADDVLYRVWYATNRRPSGDKRAYGARLGDQVHLGHCDVVIPESHRIGELGSWWIRRVIRGIDDRLRVQQVTAMESDAFWTGVQAVSTLYPAERRHALVFIHGYRVSFTDAALRAAQLGYDLSIRGPVAFFSWPSRATLIGYPADGSAVEASESAITEFLIQFARNCGADHVHLIAHSMGNRPLLRALQRILSAAEAQSAVHFGHLILAAPDITRELFLDVAEHYRRLSHRTTLYVSKADRALRASFRLQGPRVGHAPPITCVPGIDTIHVANVDRTLLGHSTFAEARPVLTDIHALLNYNAPPELRAGLIERQQGSDRYWEVRA